MTSQNSNPSFANELQSLLTSHNITTAVIVDDAAQRTIRDDLWIELLDAIDVEDDSIRLRLEDLLNSKDVTLSNEPPPAEHHNDVFELLLTSTSARVAELISKTCFAEAALDSLFDHLKALGLNVTPFFSPDDAPHNESLYFVDFDIADTHGNAGQRAERFLAQITKSQKLNGKCPAVVLMSRLDRKGGDITSITDSAHVVRFCFRFFNKESLAESLEQLSFDLLELFETFPLAERYIQHVDALRKSLVTAAEMVTNELLRLTPADFAVFASKKLGGHGPDSLRHLHFLFNGLLESSLRESAAVNESFETFSNTLAATPISAMTKEGFVLDELHAKVLYDRSAYTLQSPVGFGDLLAEGPEERGRFLLVLTPECDMEVRTDGCPKAERILLLEGNRSPERQKKTDYLLYSPLLGTSDGRRVQWIEWNLRRLHSVERDVLMSGLRSSGGVYRRWGRMRHEFAEQLQQRFATDLLEVGTEEILSGFSQRSASVFGGRNGATELGSVVICEMQIGESDVLWALGEDSQALLSAVGDTLAARKRLRKFRSFLGKSDVVGQLKQMGLHTKELNGDLVFVAIADINSWVVPEKWKVGA